MKPRIGAPADLASWTSRFRDTAGAGVDDAGADLVVAHLLQRALNGLARALDVRLDEDRQFRDLFRSQLGHHVDQADLVDAAGGLLALDARAVLGQLAGAGLVLDHGERLAGARGLVQTQDLDGHGRTGFGQLFAAFVEQGADATEAGAGDDEVALLQRAALDQDGRDRAATLVQLGLDDHAFGRAFRIGLEVHDLGLQQDGLDQAVQVGAGLGRDLDDLGVAAQGLADDFVLQ